MCRALCRVQTHWQSQSTGFRAFVNKSTSIWKLCILRTKVPLVPRTRCLAATSSRTKTVFSEI